MTISFGSSPSGSDAEISEHFDEQRLKEEKVKESNATKLLAAAWFIEICAAGIGFFFAYTTGEATRKYLAQDTEAFIGNPEISVLLAMLPFMIIGVVELTKIPLAYAAYNAKPSFWKALFIGVLLSLCFITGETIFTGMERSLDNQLKYFEGDKKLQEELKVDVLNLEKQVSELEDERPTDDIDREYDSEIRAFEQNHYIKLDELNDERQARLTELETKKLESRDMFNNASSQNEIGNLQRILDTQLSSLKDRENRLDSEIQNIRQTAQLEIDSKQNQITVLSESIAAITQEFTSGLFSNNSQKEDQLEAERNAREKAEIELESIKLKRDEGIKSFRDGENIKLSQLQEGIASTQLRLTEARLKSEAEFDKEQDGINIEINQLVARYNARQADIQKKYEEEKSLREKNYLEARNRSVRAQTDRDQALAEIKSKNKEITDIEQIIDSKAGEIQVMRFAATYAEIKSNGDKKRCLEEGKPEDKCDELLRKRIADVTAEDIGIIMLFWFGSIALIAATTGTVISFASFYIRDRKNWEYSWKDDLDEESRWQELLESRRQKNKARREYYLKRINGELEPGIFRSIGNSIVRLIDAMIKRLREPKVIKEVKKVKKYLPYDYSKGKPVDDHTKDE